MRVINLFTESILTNYNLLPVTHILAASQGSSGTTKNQLALNALECLTPSETSLAKQCDAVIRDLREHRNLQQYPRPSKDHALKLLSKSTGGFSPEDLLTFRAYIHTSRRLPSPGENAHSDLDLFGDVPDMRAEKLEEKLRILKGRRAMLERGAGGQGSASKPTPRKRNSPEDEDSEEEPDAHGDGHLTKKSKISAAAGS